MIILANDCIVFRTPSGEGFPHSAESLTIEIIGETASMFDAEFIKQAAGAVLHYFRDELGRQSVTMAEFSHALENILRGFKLAAAVEPETGESAPRVLKSDLRRLVAETSNGGELVFFPRLRDELRSQLGKTPQMLCFQGIRPCVKQLAGARRWSQRCQALHDQIVEYLRSCMLCEQPAAACALVVR
jgi:hypothetical protein